MLLLITFVYLRFNVRYLPQLITLLVVFLHVLIYLVEFCIFYDL